MKKVWLIIIAIVISAGVGYFFGFDHGFEKSVRETKQFIANCELEAEKSAREALKPDYGDTLRIEEILTSPHYRERYSQCLAQRGL